MKNFSDLSEQEILALAITLEEEDRRIYGELSRRACATTIRPRRRSFATWRPRRARTGTA